MEGGDEEKERDGFKHTQWAKIMNRAWKNLPKTSKCSNLQPNWADWRKLVQIVIKQLHIYLC